MNAEFFEAVADIEKEKGIPREYMFDKITQAMLAAFRKDNPDYEGDVEVLLDESARKIQLVERLPCRASSTYTRSFWPTW